MIEAEKQNLEDEKVIQAEYDALIQDYLNSNHRKKVAIIEKAFLFSKEAHKGIRRRSGESYILHPLAVARIVCKEIGLGSTSICSALLHDVVEDTEYTVEDIKNQFGEKVANIVDGLTKISSNMLGENVSAQAENFRKLLLTMSDDIRVILIKISDRLHNMRTLGSMAPAKQYKISGETMYVYAPLAHRLGLFAIKTELEELSFRWENPDVYNEIAQKLKDSHAARKDVYEHFAKPVVEKLNTLDIKYEIKAREKSIYSIWKKKQTKNIPFEEIYDIFAVRIIFEAKPGEDEKKRCWDIYSCITDVYKLRPDRIRDWVSRPKANGYQALHLTVMGPDGQWIEVQIRSRRMHEIAEKGFAAHWRYKEGNIDEDTELEKWLKTVQEILESPSPNAMEFLDTIKLNLFSHEIFVFTPKGDIKTLPQGATALDFAYEIHSDIGDRCIGAKVNYKLVPISHQLMSGDQVELLTSKSQQPKEEWIEFATTAKARSKLEYALRRMRRDVIKKGEEILQDSFKESPVELNGSVLDRILDYYQLRTREDLYYAIGNKEIDLPQRMEKLLTARRQNKNNFFMRYMKQAYNAVVKTDKKGDESQMMLISETEEINPKKTYLLDGSSFARNFRMMSCCAPLAGDKVFGYLTKDNIVEVHAISCPMGEKLKANYGDNIINLDWKQESGVKTLSKLIIKGIDRPGMLSDISQLVSKNLSLNIKSINLETKDGVFEGHMVLYVHDAADINTLSSQLMKIDGVKSVNRVYQKDM